jgi:hypothetical protein
MSAEQRRVWRDLDHQYAASAAMQIATHALGLSFTDLPPDVVHHAKRNLLDGLGCAIGGYGAPGRVEHQVNLGPHRPHPGLQRWPSAADPGGKTRYGVTEAVARANGYTGDMRELPLDVARRIYRAAYWDAVRADELPAAVRYAVFDAAVNSGVRQSVRWLQRAVDATDDGVLGPATLRAVQRQEPEVLLRKLLAQRLQFMAALPTWPSFGRGWARRVAALMEA